MCYAWLRYSVQWGSNYEGTIYWLMRLRDPGEEYVEAFEIPPSEEGWEEYVCECESYQPASGVVVGYPLGRDVHSILTTHWGEKMTDVRIRIVDKPYPMNMPCRLRWCGHWRRT